MGIGEDFENLLANLRVDNSTNISQRYGQITSVLNRKFRDTESETANSLQVGSYGRYTAIKGISDLDMLYIMPSGKWTTYNVPGGQLKLLQDTKAAISARYPTTKVKVDRLVVTVTYANFHVEVQPVFEDATGYWYPDTKNGGSWKLTKPREEISEISAADIRKNRNLRRLCRMARAWKNKHGIAMGGLLIDTLAYNFLSKTDEYDNRSYYYYDWMSRDFFLYLKDLPHQDRYHALGSNQWVRVKKAFQSKAKKAYELCLKAIEVGGTPVANETWRKLYGRGFPAAATTVTKAALEAFDAALHTEEFIEDQFPVDIRYDIALECEVLQDGFRPQFLRQMLSGRIPLKARKSLVFKVSEHDIPGTFDLYWKVLNRGEIAVRKKCLRGQILPDQGRFERREATDFRGDHIVECYAVQDGVVVAKDRILVPIANNRDDPDE